ncbi:MAG: hypothetical protein RLZZ406_1126 [Pseudomonadota bacterium]
MPADKELQTKLDIAYNALLDSEILLSTANDELVFQNKEKVKRASELVVANKELFFQREEKAKRAAELVVANIELAFQNKEKANRASELVVANKKLSVKNQEGVLLSKSSGRPALMEQELRKAIEQNQFQLYYQIQVDCTGQALGAEALIRWQHPERGMISPFNFIPLAEDTGLILPIGIWVLDTACAQLRVWQQNTLTQELILAVNVSAKQFFQVDFVEQVNATLKRHDINPERLKLELTESVFADNIDDIIIKMNVLRKIGVQFSLDDFGTGYSSLQYLKMLPFNQLKIDQSFVRGIATNASDRAIVSTIITLAHSLNIRVIAEGVETDEQHQFLLDSGCTSYQGYLFSKPLRLEEFEALLSKT